MAELFLHHYDLSPFSEKIRLAFGYKGLAWRSVDIPIWPPRPDTDPLAAGYRRVPMLQVGADVYCDTMLILRELDRRHPEPTLYPGGQTGLATVLGWWADTTMFMPAASVTTSVIGDGIPEDFLKDRVDFMKHDFSKAASVRDLPRNRQRTAAQMQLLAELLADGRPFVLGPALSVADLAAYHILWFAKKNGGAEVEAMLPYAPLLAWMARIDTVGHGKRSDATAEEALEVARAADPAPTAGVAADDPSGLRAGQRVTVVTDDNNGPIAGELVAANPSEMVLATEDPRVGRVHVHLPRIGYSAMAAAA